MTTTRDRKKTDPGLQQSPKASKRLARENAVFCEIGRIVSSSLKIEEIYERFAEEVRKIIPFDRLEITLANPEGDRITTAYATGLEVGNCHTGDTKALSGSVAGEVIRTRSSLRLQMEKVNEWKDRFPCLLNGFEAGIRSMIAVPLISTDQVMGNLCFSSIKKIYSVQDLKLAGQVALLISEAIAHAIVLSEMKKMEKLLQRSEERYRALTEESKDTEKDLEQQLLQLQKMESIGLLAGGLAHDVNNLVTVILGNAEIGLMGIEPSHRFYEIFTAIKEGAKKTSALTRRILDFSRHQVLQPKVLNVVKLIGNFSQMVSRLIGETIELKIECGQNLGHIHVDQAAIDQVLMNLVINARDAMSQGGVITIQAQNVHLDEAFSRLHPFVKPGDYMKMSVLDTGVGMDENILQHIFKPFFTTKERGTGLGLAMVYGIVKQHGGYVMVLSQVGQGSRFDIYLPIYRGPVFEESMEAQAETIPRGTETILLAEDEEEVRELFQSFLRELGYKMFVAKDGDEAMSIFSANREEIDLVILDAMMPKRSGSKVFGEMRLLSSDLPGIILTGYSEAIVRKHLDRGLEIPVLRKPVTFLELGRKVREVLDRSARKTDRFSNGSDR